MNRKTESKGGIGICGLLGVVFITLKLCHVIDWPWVWVTAPLWIPIAFLILCVIVLAVIDSVNDGRR